MRELARGKDDAFAVLLDDDLRYRAWALSWLESAILTDARRERHAYSYDVCKSHL